MVGEHDPLVVSQVADDLAQLEARTNPVHVGEPISQGFARDTFSFGVVRQRADGVGVHVVDVGERQESVQEGLNGGAPRAGIHQSPGHKIGHLFVGHLTAITQRCQFRKTQRRVVRFDRPAHVGAGALDPHHLLLSPEVINDSPLGRRVASPVHDE